MTEVHNEHRRFQEHVPFYLNGTLGPIDRKFVEDYLQRYPHGNAEIEFSLRIRDVVKKTAAHRNDDDGLERLLNDWHSEAVKPLFRGTVFQAFTRFGFTPAIALLAILVIIQLVGTVTFMVLESQRTKDEYATVRSAITSAPTVFDLKVTFEPKTQLVDVARLIQEAGCRIVAVTPDSRAYLLALEDKSKNEYAQKRLRESPLVKAVEAENY